MYNDLQGTYHKMSEKHLNRYVQEIAGRHNVREEDTLDQMGRVIKSKNGKALTYWELVS